LLVFRFRVKDSAKPAQVAGLHFAAAELNDGLIPTSPADGQVVVAGVATGSLSITLEPVDARAAGVAWRVDSGDWMESGQTVEGLAVSEHAVEYRDAAGWDAPTSETAVVAANETTSFTRNYMRQTGSLLVTIEPEAARPAGALWRVDAGEWRQSGAQLDGLSIGEHTVEYLEVSGWAKAGNQIVVILANQVVEVEGVYTIETGSIQVSIEPLEAVDLGAQWRVDGGAWHDSGETVGGLSLGPHEVSWKDIGGAWTTPDDFTIEVAAGQTATHTAVYTYCEDAPAPGNVQASDGTFSDNVLVTWDAVTGTGVEYQVWRSPASTFDEAQPVSAWLTATEFEDATAEAPTEACSPLGCPGGQDAVQFHYYWYWVKARRAADCESDPSGPDQGYRGRANETKIYEPAMPRKQTAEGLRVAHPASVLAVRLRSTEPVVPSTVWARVVGPGFETDFATWLPCGEDPTADGWVLCTPIGAWPVGERLQVAAGALTPSGETIGPVTFDFYVTDDQPELDGAASAGYESAEDSKEADAVFSQEAESVPTLPGGLGQVFLIEPDAVFAEPKRVWLPLPANVQSEDVSVHYLLESSGKRAWYPWDAVEGWVQTGSFVETEVDGIRYLGFIVNHGATVQLALPGQSGPSGSAGNAASVLGNSDKGSILLISAVAVLLAIAKRAGLRRRKAA
jgi:hypothetical protein